MARPVQSLGVTLFLLLATTCVRSTIVLDDTDPAIIYNGKALPTGQCQDRPDNDDCSGGWWIEGAPGSSTYPGDYNDTVHNTFGPNTSLTLSFLGSSIGVYGLVFNAGAQALVSVDDGKPEAMNTTSWDGQSHPNVLLYKFSGMEPTKVHYINITYDAACFGSTWDRRRWLSIDYFVYELPPGTASPSGTNASSPTESAWQDTTSPTSQSAAESMQERLIVGFGAVGIIAILGALAFLIQILLRRRRRRPGVPLLGRGLALTESSGSEPDLRLIVPVSAMRHDSTPSTATAVASAFSHTPDSQPRGLSRSNTLLPLPVKFATSRSTWSP